MASIRCGQCHETHDSVAAVRACYAGESLSPERRLAESAGLVQRRQKAAERVEASRTVGAWAKGASGTRNRSVDEISEGFYKHNARIFKVQKAVHGSGRLYAKVLEVEETGEVDGKTEYKGTWEYAKGAVFQLRPEEKLTQEQAAEFGKLYGVCCLCGRTLTNEESIAAGIGPICAGKQGW